MSALLPIRFARDEADTLTAAEGRIAVLLPEEGRIGRLSRRLDRLSRGAIGRAMAGEGWAKLKPGEGMDLAWPAGLKAEALHLVKLPRRAGVDDARKAGAAIGSTRRITFGSVSAVNSRKTQADWPSAINWSKSSTARLTQ